jgi:transcription elongation factor GreA
MLNTATFVDETQASLDVVNIGCRVKVYDIEYDEEDEYVIVGYTEADPAKLWISSESPIGEALMGARVGDTVKANTPGGIAQLKVLEIGRR